MIFLLLNHYSAVHIRGNQIRPNAAYKQIGHCREKKMTKMCLRVAILYADRGDRRKSPGVPGAAIAIFADRRDRRIKSPIFGMSDIGD